VIHLKQKNHTQKRPQNKKQGGVFQPPKGGEPTMTLNPKQQAFCREYLIDLNATQAAIRAGYSQKTANTKGAQLLAIVDIKERIQADLEKLTNERVAKAQEVMEYLTSVMRGQSESQIVVVEGTGEGCSQARRISKNPDEREKLKAAELLGKRWSLFQDNLKIEGGIPIIIRDDLTDDDDDEKEGN
jgi:phage terminase small subunit